MEYGDGGGGGCLESIEGVKDRERVLKWGNALSIPEGVSREECRRVAGPLREEVGGDVLDESLGPRA